MWIAAAASVDMAHALLMALWVFGLPLLFWRRWPTVSRTYAAFALAFVAVNLTSRALLGECVLTTIARALWDRAAREAPPGAVTVSGEWSRCARRRPSFA